MTWILVLRVILIILGNGLGGMGVKSALGFHATSQCVQLGQADYNRKSSVRPPYSTFNASEGEQDPGYYTIGAYKFTTTHWFLDPVFGPHNNAFSPGKPPEWTNNAQLTCPYKNIASDRANLCPADDKVGWQRRGRTFWSIQTLERNIWRKRTFLVGFNLHGGWVSIGVIDIYDSDQSKCKKNKSKLTN